ncbi:hypothetical protein [Thermoflavimicrobium dichotomicum]|uniref:Uncharacterized protein n=1 Tax=Thermoflavimicrobium dichotomicum TaxID=46223 RepID=A0A1I3PRV4_9BACL|nr:hypothetical protein [Thermoflavimicrobium dichotomicum]SFJ24067.1 hypothetical protein SAMN05421852_10686 [Thermoflavimicrobium dichotomicum]
MSKWRYIPSHQLNRQHTGKPTKLLLKNGKVIYGTIKEIRKNGIIFLPINNQSRKKKNMQSTLIFFPIFIPIGFFIPFIIF